MRRRRSGRDRLSSTRLILAAQTHRLTRMVRSGLVPAEALPAPVIVGVDLDVLLPLVGQLVLSEARVHRARLDAGVAVDALLGVDVQLRLVVEPGLLLGRVDAIDRANLDARQILRSDTRLRDHIRHPLTLPGLGLQLTHAALQLNPGLSQAAADRALRRDERTETPSPFVAMCSRSGSTRSSNIRHTSMDSQSHLLQIFSKRRTELARSIRPSSSGSFSTA